MSLRERLGWNPFFEAHAAALAGRGYAFVRIVEEQRGLSRVAGDVDGWMDVSGKFRYEAAAAAAFPAIGDWVAVRDNLIHVTCSSGEASSRGRRQDGPPPNRWSPPTSTLSSSSLRCRTMSMRGGSNGTSTMVWDGGAVPVVVVNKSDLSDDADAASHTIAARLPLVDVVAVSAFAQSWARRARAVSAAGPGRWRSSGRRASESRHSSTG